MSLYSKDLVVVLDFGSQYTQLIARRVRECGIYSEIFPYNVNITDLSLRKPKCIILSGSPALITSDNFPVCDSKIFELDVPILGICYGMQLLVKMLGGKVLRSGEYEYGKTELFVDKADTLFSGFKRKFVVWMSHYENVVELPEGFEVIAHTEKTPIAAIRNSKKKIYGLQFHPEVFHTQNGKKIFDNFLKKIARCKKSWSAKPILSYAIEAIKRKVGNNKVVCAVSGGVDSTTLALLLNKAISKNLICIFINTGLMRKNEPEEVINRFRRYDINLTYIDAAENFLKRLRGITDPEEKRKIIGEEFIRIFTERARKIGGAKFLAQGTLYPDVIESGVVASSSKIKTHHNVGGLPEKLGFELIEPFRNLFKDEVRMLAKELGLDKELITRHPFPGPGLAVRIIGEVSEENLRILREVDDIIQQEIKKSGIYEKLWQVFGVILPIKTVGVRGDKRSYERVVAIRAVKSQDGMTADWAKLPYRLLEKISSRIVNEVKGVNRVVYDITSKPPATIEWE